MNVYTSAWDKGLKTTYYLHMKPRHTAEQSTTTVNKSEALGKRGFAAIKDKLAASTLDTTTASTPAPAATAPILSSIEMTPVKAMSMPELETSPKLKIHVPEDPMDQLLCEGCQ